MCRGVDGQPQAPGWRRIIDNSSAGVRVSTELTHLNTAGEARMVDIGSKPMSEREAVAEALIRMRRETLALILSGGHHKGDVFAVARIAGIQAAKRCAELIPLCHPLGLDAVELQL